MTNILLFRELLDREPDLIAFGADDLRANEIAHFHDVFDVLHETVLQFGNVDHAVLAAAEIDDRAEFEDLHDIALPRSRQL